MRTPANNTLWKHSKTGNTYRVVTCARMEKTGEWVVVYHREWHSENTFIRPVKEWLEEVELVSKFPPGILCKTQRFVPIVGESEAEHKFYVDREPYGDESKWAQT